MGDLKNRQRYTNSFRKELIDKLKELSEKSKIPQSRLLDEAIELVLRKYEKLAK
jgi:predicted DNA-binding protein